MSGAKVHLICSDGKEIYLDEATALMSENLAIVLETEKGRIHEPDLVQIDMPSDLVEKVFRYCHSNAHLQPRELETFNSQFFKDADYSELCRLIKASITFNIDCLWKTANDAFDDITGGKGFIYHSKDIFSLPF